MMKAKFDLISFALHLMKIKGCESAYFAATSLLISHLSH